jgi:hypothetical protein
MQTKLLLLLATTIGVGSGCGGENSKSDTARLPDSQADMANMSESRPETGRMSDTIIRYLSDTIIKKQNMASLRDTIIKHKASKDRDTIIMHAAATVDSCKKIPRPPECPSPFLSLKIDTIIK